AFAAAPPSPPPVVLPDVLEAEPGVGAPNGVVDAGKAAIDKKDDQGTRALVDKYRSSSTIGRATGILPIRVSFPAFGPFVYLVSELTSENQTPSADLGYQQEKKGGVK